MKDDYTISCTIIQCLDLETMIWENIQTQGEAPPPLANHTGDLVENSIYIYGGFSKEQKL